MKKITLLAFLAFCAMTVSAQTMQVKSDGSVVFEQDVNAIDEVTFSEASSTEPQFYFKKSFMNINWGDTVKVSDMLVSKNLVSDVAITSNNPKIMVVLGDELVALDCGPAIIQATTQAADNSVLTATLYIMVGNGAYLYIEDKFSLAEQGTIVTGKVLGRSSDDKIISGQPVVYGSILAGSDSKIMNVQSIEMFRKLIPEAKVGDSVGLLFGAQIAKDDINIGDIIYMKNNSSIIRSQTVKGILYVRTKEEGGRHTPIMPNYRPQLYFGSTNITATLTSLGTVDGEAAEMIMPGKTAEDVTFQFIDTYTPYLYIGQEIEIREGGRLVAVLTITGY